MNDRYASALGVAVIEKWGELPQEVQQTLFEAAVIAGIAASKTNPFANNWRSFCMRNILGRQTDMPRLAPGAPGNVAESRDDH
jgi:hypothetical protein